MKLKIVIYLLGRSAIVATSITILSIASSSLLLDYTLNDLINSYHDDPILSLLPIFILLVILLFLPIHHYEMVIKSPYGLTEETIGMHHIRNFLSNLSYNDAFYSCCDFIEKYTPSSSRFKVIYKDFEKGILIGKPIIMKIYEYYLPDNIIWSDVIYVRLVSINKEKTHINIETGPSIPAFDFGRNLINIEAFIKYLQELEVKKTES